MNAFTAQSEAQNLPWSEPVLWHRLEPVGRLLFSSQERSSATPAPEHYRLLEHSLPTTPLGQWISEVMTRYSTWDPGIGGQGPPALVLFLHCEFVFT